MMKTDEVDLDTLTMILNNCVGVKAEDWKVVYRNALDLNREGAIPQNCEHWCGKQLHMLGYKQITKLEPFSKPYKTTKEYKYLTQ